MDSMKSESERTFPELGFHPRPPEWPSCVLP